MEPVTHKRCSYHGHKGKRYLPLSEFHKAGVRYGKQKYKSWCKRCANSIDRERYNNDNPTKTKQWDHKKTYLRARGRALTRLTHLVPELWEQVLVDECNREGITIRGVNDERSRHY